MTQRIPLQAIKDNHDKQMLLAEKYGYKQLVLDVLEYLNQEGNYEYLHEANPTLIFVFKDGQTFFSVNTANLKIHSWNTMGENGRSIPSIMEFNAGDWVRFMQKKGYKL